MPINIRVEKGFPKSHLSLKPGDIFFEGDDRTHPYMIVSKNYVVDIVQSEFLVMDRFAGKNLTIARSASLIIEV